MIAVMFGGIFWARKRDARDELNMARIKKKQKRIYVNLFLEPIPEIRKKEPEKVKPKKTEEYEQVNQIIDDTMRAASPIKLGKTPMGDPDLAQDLFYPYQDIIG